MMDAGGGAGADGDAVAVLDGAVFDEDVGAAGLDDDVVVAGVDVAVADEEVGARAGVDGIGVGGIEWGADLDALDGQVGDVAGHEVEHRGVGQREVRDEEALAAINDDEVGAPVNEPARLGARRAF